MNSVQLQKASQSLAIPTPLQIQIYVSSEAQGDILSPNS